ncbi:hypothetical protein N7490_005238 [Penicillium lividum]|nr:hypothetical protein N7490_005238 [Penicillium lividum]
MKLRFSIISVISLVGAGMVSALPSDGALVVPGKRNRKTVENESKTSDCVDPLLCCGSLTTPLDHIVDPILLALGIDTSAIIGDLYEAKSCSSAPQCCTEANLLDGTVALGCSAFQERSPVSRGFEQYRLS